jgi:hypothetical protein
MIADATIRVALEGTTVVSEGKKVTRTLQDIREENQKLGASTGEAGKGLASLKGILSRLGLDGFAKQFASLRAGFQLFAGFLAGSAILGALRGLAGQIIETGSAYEQLRAQLVTVTGDADRAALAFAGILQFATNTPFEVDELTGAFIRLGAVGIRPTTALMTSIGNTAAAFGKKFSDFADAVIGASVGEMERLKQFGIVARQEKDKVSFIFQGVTTTVKKNAKDIVAYLQTIGETQYAGAMAVQMDTLKGKWSNLKDAVAQLWDELFRSGADQGLKSLIVSMTELVQRTQQFVREVREGSSQLGVFIQDLARTAALGGATFRLLLSFLMAFIRPLLDALALVAKFIGYWDVLGAAAAQAMGKAAKAGYEFVGAILDGLADLVGAVAELPDAVLFFMGAKPLAENADALSLKLRGWADGARKAGTDVKALMDEVANDRLDRWANQASRAAVAVRDLGNAMPPAPPGPPPEMTEKQISALERLKTALEEAALARENEARLTAAAVVGPEEYQRVADQIDRGNKLRALENVLVAAGLELSGKLRDQYNNDLKAAQDQIHARERWAAAQERLNSTMSTGGDALAAFQRLTASSSLAEVAQSAVDLSSAIELVRETVNSTTTSTAQYAELLALMNQLLAAQASADLKVKDALEQKDRLIRQQAANLRDRIAAIDEETAAVLAGSRAYVAFSREQEILNEIWENRQTHVAGEGAAEFSARWRAAAEEVRAALERAFAAQDAAAIRDYVAEPFRQAFDQIEGFAVEAMDAFRTGGFDAVEDVAKRFLDTWIRALEQWLYRWLVTMAKARAAQAVLGSSGGGGKVDDGQGVMGVAQAGYGYMGGGTAATGTAVSGGGGGAYVLGGSGSGAAGAYLGWLFIAAVAIAIIYKGFIEKSSEWAEASTRGARTGNDRKVKDTVSRRIQQLIAEVEAISKAFDIEFKQIGDVTLGKFNGKYYVKDAMYPIGRAFDSAEAAMEYARVRALQLAEYGDEVSRMVQAAIRGSRAMDTNQLRADIDRARELENIGKPQSQADLDGILQQYRDRVAWIIDIFRHDLTAMAEALSQAGMGLTLSLQGVRDQITGRQKTPAEEAAERARLVAMYNATLTLMRAELEAKKLDMMARLADIRAIIAHGGAAIGHARILITTTEIIGKAMNVSLTLLEAQAAALEAQIAAIDALIAALPKPIDPNDFDGDGIKNEDDKTPWGGSPGGGRGNTRKEDQRTLGRDLDQREAARGGDVASSIFEINRAYEEQAKLAHGNTELLGRLNAQRQHEMDLLKKQTLKDARSFINRGTAKGGEVMTGLGEITDEAAELGKGLQALADAGTEAKWKIAALQKQLEDAAEAQRQQLGQQAYGGLLMDLYSLLGDEEASAQLKFQLTLADLKIRREELAIAIQKYKLEGINLGLLDELIDKYEKTGGKDDDDKETNKELPRHYLDNTQAIQAHTNALKKATETFRGFIADLVESNREVLTDESTSSLSTKDRFEFALGEYTRNRDKAFNGDPEAWRQLVELRSSLLDVGKEWFADGNGDARFRAGYRELLAMTVKDFAELAIDPRAEQLTLEALYREQTESTAAFRKETDQNLKQLREAVVWGALAVSSQVGNIDAGPGVTWGPGGVPVAPVTMTVAVATDPETKAAMQAMAAELRTQTADQKTILLALQLLAQGRKEDAAELLELLQGAADDIEDTRNAIVRRA